MILWSLVRTKIIALQRMRTPPEDMNSQFFLFSPSFQKCSHDQLMNAPPPPPAPPAPPPTSTTPHSSPPPQSHLSLNLLLPPSAPSLPSPPPPLTRIKLSDITPYEGACSSAYQKAVDALSSSLTRHNAAVVELGATGEDVAVMRCALESVRMFFKARDQGLAIGGGGKLSRGVYVHRAGRSLEDGEISPPCMCEVFRHLGKAARIVLSAIARHFRLRTDVFSDLLDETPLPPNEISSSRVVASFSNCALPNGKRPPGRSTIDEIEKGFVTLIVSDHPGIQVCDPNGHWYLADASVGPTDLLLLTGKALSHCTAGLRPAALYHTSDDVSCSSSSSSTISRASLMFKLMPKANAVLDCSRIVSVGHCIPQSYQPIFASQLMDELSAEDDMISNLPEGTPESRTNLPREASLLSVLSDSSSGAFLEDAMVVSCGHSFGGQTLKKVIEMARCALCNAEVDRESLIPNFTLRAAATVVKVENANHIATLRKRRREEGEQINAKGHFGKDNGETAADLGGLRFFQGAQFPFSVNEKVLIKGNRRTPERFVGRKAIITSQCLNGWFLLKILDTGESVRLQYRSLQKLSSSQASNNR